ncbi:hypothetical protein [Moraxella lacunata]
MHWHMSVWLQGQDCHLVKKFFSTLSILVQLVWLVWCLLAFYTPFLGGLF